MISQKTLKLYVYVDGVNDIPFYGSASIEFEEFILSNGETFVTKDGYVFNVRTMSEQIEIGSFRYDAQRMGGAPTLTFTLMYKDCLDKLWSENVYAVFNNERHFLKMTPTSSKTNDDTRYKHEVELVAERKILDDAYFYDAVVGIPQENDKPVTNDTEFNFYGNIADFAKRMNASLQYTKLQKVKEDGTIEGYYVVIDEGIKTEDKQLAFDGAVFSQALQESYNTFGIPFYFVGKEIHLGFTNNAIEDVLEYGADNALLSITKQNANFKVVNRATGKGSTDNIPYYYPNNAPKGEIIAESSNENLEVEIVNYEKYSSSVDINEEIKKTSVTTSDFKARYYPRDNEYLGEEDIYSGDEIITKTVYNYSLEAIYEFTFKANESGVLHFYFDPREVGFTQLGGTPNRDDNGLSSRSVYYLFKIENGKQVLLDSNQAMTKGRRELVLPIPTENAEYLLEVHASYAINAKYGSQYGYLSFAPLFGVESQSGWTNKAGEEIYLEDIGLAIVGDEEAQIGDTITQRLVQYTKSTGNLQPSIYRATKGKERFYNAINYPFDYVEGYELQYGEYIGEDDKVHNDLYKKDNGEYIKFANPYAEGNPKEHVFSVDDIKPTIKEMTNSIVWQEENEETGEMVNVYQRIDMFSEFAYDVNDNDETYTDKDNNTAFKHPYFFAKLRKLDFNLFDCAIEQQNMTISFTSGNCGACNFTVGVSEEYPRMNPVQVDENGNLVRDEEGRVLCGLEDFQPAVKPQPEQQDTINHEVWIALKKEEDTYGILMPKAPKYEGTTLVEAGHRPKGATWDEQKGVYLNDADTFVILGINLPEEYTLFAEKKLEKKIIQYIVENNNEKFNFSINFSRIFLEENPNFLEQLNENARLNVRYNGEVYLLYVSSFSYNMGEGEILPEISVELDDTLTIAQNALQNAIDSVRGEIGQAVNSLDMVALGGSLFLRKDTDDVSQGIIDFRKGIMFGNGGEVSVYPDGSAKLSIDYLEVTKKATFTSLEIQERNNIGGQLLITPAAMTCSYVEELDDVYRCYFQNEGENGDEVYNTFAIDDQAICQTFNTWGSKFYWRLVVGVGDNYIDLSKTECASESDVPSIGDKIVQLGNKSNKARQAAQVLSSNGENAPSFVMYNGIDSFSIEGKEVTGIAWNPESQEPEMYTYGSFYFGDKEKDSSHISYSRLGKTLNVKASVNIEEGSIMSSRLDVGNPETGDIEAFFNGGDFAEDADCGKLILAAGIPTVEESGQFDLDSRASMATTRIYEDGCTYTKNMHLQDGCSIAEDFEILNIEGSGVIRAIDYDDYDEDIDRYGSIGFSSSIFSANRYTICPASVVIQPQNYSSRYAALITKGMRGGSPSGEGNIGLVIGAKDGDAIYCIEGTFAGLRPKIRTITASSTNSEFHISKYDHTIMVASSSAIGLAFTKDAEIVGQEIIIMMNNEEGTPVKHTIYTTKDCLIVDSVAGSSAKESINIAAKGMVKFVCADNGSGVKRWWYYRLA